MQVLQKQLPHYLLAVASLQAHCYLLLRNADHTLHVAERTLSQPILRQRILSEQISYYLNLLFMRAAIARSIGTELIWGVEVFVVY